jgi:hypothetical protein
LARALRYKRTIRKGGSLSFENWQKKERIK